MKSQRFHWYTGKNSLTMEIKDHYHKYVVCRGPLIPGNNNGIEMMYIADFLLKENCKGLSEFLCEQLQLITMLLRSEGRAVVFSVELWYNEDDK